jgi:hypothetical protein
MMEESSNSGVWRPSVSWVCAVFVVSITFLFYLHFVLAFGVNVPFWDDWQLLDQARQVYLGQMHWWMLLVNKHNEHLIGTDFLLSAWQLSLTDFNYRLQLVTGVLIQGVAFAVMASLVWRTIPQNRRPLWLSVAALIWFSWCQYKNLLWAFQTAWFLVTILLAITLFSLGRASRTDATKDEEGTWFTVALVAALLATFTSSQGSIVWFAAAVYLAGERSYNIREVLKTSLFRKWLVSSVVACFLASYVWFKLGGGVAGGGGKFTLRTCIYIFFAAHGDFWGNLGVHNLAVMGVVMLSFVCLALLKVAFSKERSVYAVPVSLIAFGTCFVVLMALGRAKFGMGSAWDSHYMAYPILNYFGVLTILIRQNDGMPKFYRSRWVPFVYMALVVFALFSSSYDALLNGISWRSEQGMGAATLLNYKDEPDFVLGRVLFGDPGFVRRNAQFLEAYHLGAFADPEAIPESVKRYAHMAKSLEDMMAHHPAQQDAIRRAWQVYQMGGDLRQAFNPLSDDFAHNLIAWCAGASVDTASPHYLSEYLRPYAASYAAIMSDKGTH